MLKKISTIAVAIVMLCISFSIVSIKAPAEDVTGPFEVRSIGWPTPTPTSDQTQTTISLSQSVQGTWWAFQTFKPGFDGKLNYIQLYYRSTSGAPGETLHISIYNTNQAGTPTTIIVDTPLLYESLPVSLGWYAITFPSTPSLTKDVEYGIMMWTTQTIIMQWNYAVSTPYVRGMAYNSINAGSSWAVFGGNNDFAFQTNMLQGGYLEKVAWHPDGTYAFAVTGYNHVVWKYTRDTATWSVAGNGPISTVVLKDIMYDTPTSMFWMVGYNSATSYAHAFSYNGNTFTSFSSTFAGKFISVASCNGMGGHVFLGVGVLNTGYAFATWRTSGAWTQVNTGFRGVLETLNSVTWNYDSGAGNCYYSVGVDNNQFGVVYKFALGSTNANLTYIVDSLGRGLEPCNAISWKPTGGYGLIGSSGIHSYGNIYKFTGSSTPVLINPHTIPVYDIGWHPDATMAVLVGGIPGSGRIYHYNDATGMVTDMTRFVPGTPDRLLGVAVKGPTSPSSAIILSSSGGFADYLDVSNTGTTLTANAVFPKVYSIGFQNDLAVSKMDQQVPVDEPYNFTVIANYSQGWTNCLVEVRAWYDNGLIGAGSTYPAETDATRNLAFRLFYWVSNGTYKVMYPSPEMEVIIPNPLWLNDIVSTPRPGIDQDEHTITMPVYFGKQLRWADGTGFVSPDDPGSDGEKSNISGLQDLWSWDFNITVRDNLNPTAFNISHAEFGIQKAVSISVTGNPSGNAPPGTIDNPMSTNSHIVYSSNTNYWVNVSIPNLLKNGVGPLNITATNVSIQNIHANAAGFSGISDLQTHITGANTNMYVWGATGVPIAPASNGQESAGPLQSDFTEGAGMAYTELQWWVSVPASTTEGIYRAVITISIDS